MAKSHRFAVPVGLVALASPPSEPRTGDTYFDTTDNVVKSWDGTQWVSGGRAGDYYVHSQAMISKVWIVEHNLGRRPVVAVEDDAKNHVYGTIFYVDDNILTVTFAHSATGHAYCT